MAVDVGFRALFLRAAHWGAPSHRCDPDGLPSVRRRRDHRDASC